MRIHVNKAENKLFRTKHVTHKLSEKCSMEIIKRVIKVFLLIWRSDFRSSMKIFFSADTYYFCTLTHFNNLQWDLCK